MAVQIIKHLIESVPQLDPKTVNDVIVGCANPEVSKAFKSTGLSQQGLWELRFQESLSIDIVLQV